MTWKIHDGFEIRALSTEEFGAYFDQHAKAIFDDSALIFRHQDFLSKSELENRNVLRARLGDPFRLNLGIFKGSEFAGWSFGLQETAETFYMVNSAILPAFRRKGLYSAVMKRMKEEALKMGFRIIFSRHTATNNAVIIPKLKEGFILSSFEISDNFGLLVHLRYYANPLRRKMMDFRAGQSRPDEEMNRALGSSA